MKKIMIVLCCFLLIGVTGCEKKESKPVESRQEKLERVLKENSYLVIDVRTIEEFEESHVKEAMNIPYDEIDEDTNLPKNKTLLVYCKSGKRSSIAYETLKKLGYDVIDLGAYDNVTLEKE